MNTIYNTVIHGNINMQENRLIQFDGSLSKKAVEFSCSYKTVGEAKRAILRDIKN